MNFQPEPFEPRLALEGTNLRCTLERKSETKLAWSFDVNDLRCIGEYTTSAGPAADDYFLVFFTSGRRYEVSWYATGRDDVLAGLGDRLGTPILTALAAETSFVSRIMWPRELDGQPVFVEREPSGGLLRRLWSRFRGVYDVNPIIDRL